MLSAAARAARQWAAAAARLGGAFAAGATVESAAQGRQLQRGWQLVAASRVATAPNGGSAEQAAAALAKARRMSGPVGILAGVFGSIVGVGGGVIIVPTIVTACRSIPQRLVSGTSLAAVLSTALASAYTYGSQGFVDLGAAALISPAAMLTAPFGARLTSKLDCAALRRILGYFLLAAAPMVPLKAYLLSRDSSSSDEGSGGKGSSGSSTEAAPADASAGDASSGASGASAASPAGSPPAGSALEQLQLPSGGKAVLLLATGAVAGVASGLLGVGGGLIVTPLLALSMDYGQTTVLGTSLLSMIPPAAAALVQHRRLGNVDLRMAVGLAAGTALGSAAGSGLAVHAPPGWLEAAFCVGMLFLGRKTLASVR